MTTFKNLHLIKEDATQKEWPIVIDQRPPTIEKYKRHPLKYNTIPHGIYSIECNLDQLSSDSNGFYVNSSGFRIKVVVYSANIFNNIFKGNIGIDLYNQCIKLYGRFDKRGQEIIFRLGEV